MGTPSLSEVPPPSCLSSTSSHPAIRFLPPCSLGSIQTADSCSDDFHITPASFRPLPFPRSLPLIRTPGDITCLSSHQGRSLWPLRDTPCLDKSVKTVISSPARGLASHCRGKRRSPSHVLTGRQRKHLPHLPQSKRVARANKGILKNVMEALHSSHPELPHLRASRSRTHVCLTVEAIWVAATGYPKQTRSCEAALVWSF